MKNIPLRHWTGHYTAAPEEDAEQYPELWFIDENGNPCWVTRNKGLAAKNADGTPKTPPSIMFQANGRCHQGAKLFPADEVKCFAFPPGEERKAVMPYVAAVPPGKETAKSTGERVGSVEFKGHPFYRGGYVTECRTIEALGFGFRNDDIRVRGRETNKITCWRIHVEGQLAGKVNSVDDGAEWVFEPVEVDGELWLVRECKGAHDAVRRSINHLAFNDVQIVTLDKSRGWIQPGGDTSDKRGSPCPANWGWDQCRGTLDGLREWLGI